jgi:hypothetical protein
MPGGVERYRAVVESTATVDFEGVLDRMRQQGSSLSPGEVLAARPQAGRVLFNQNDLRAGALDQQLTITA